MAKSADAFRTISEVAEWLEVPAHVLRFWESKFTQVKPVKRAGGRRYYRPADMRLLGGIKALLHDEGMTIKGAQKLLREEGVQHVAALSQGLDDAIDETVIETTANAAPVARVIGFDRPAAQPGDQAGDPEDGADPAETSADDAHPKLESARPDDEDARPAETPGAAQDAAPHHPATPETSADLDETPEHEPEQASDAEPDHEPAPKPPDSPRPDNLFADLDAPPEASAEAPEERLSPLPPLPDLPVDPADNAACPSGALGAVATLTRPVSTDLARNLAPLADRLRACGADKPGNDGKRT